MPSPTRAAALAALLALALASAACGRKGPPEYPAGTVTEKVTTPEGKVIERPVKPSRRFVLDPLLN